jgi:hypothetical protein
MAEEKVQGLANTNIDDPTQASADQRQPHGQQALKGWKPT